MNKNLKAHYSLSKMNNIQSVIKSKQKEKKPPRIAANIQFVSRCPNNSERFSNKKIVSSEEKTTQNPYIAIRLFL